MRKSRLLHRTTILWLLLMFFGALSLAWGAAPLTLTQKDSGKTLTLPVGQRMVVDLSLGAGQYVVAPEFNPSILTLAGQSLQSTSGPQGSSSRVIYQFVVWQGGTTDLVIAARGSGTDEGKKEPLLKVKIVATGGGEAI